MLLLGSKPNEEHVVFISNLPYRALKEEVERFFDTVRGHASLLRAIMDACDAYETLHLSLLCDVVSNLVLFGTFDSSPMPRDDTRVMAMLRLRTK